MRWALSALLALGGLGCSEVAERVEIVFPDPLARELTAELAVTVFEPLVSPPGEPTRFVGCVEVGAFRPTSAFAVGELGSSGLSVFTERERLAADAGFDHALALPRLDPTPRNPWGLVSVVVEARASIGEGSTTVAQGCFCVRTSDGSHADATLDAAVKQACARLEEGDARDRVVDLDPVLPSSFRADACGSGAIAFERGSRAIDPPAAACLRPIPCVDPTTTPDCFDGPRPLDLSGVPVLFELEDAGRSIERRLVVSGFDGSASAPLGAPPCAGDVLVRARVLGRVDPPVEMRGACVDPVPAYRCEGDLSLAEPPSMRPVLDVTRLPGPEGRPDVVAVLQGGNGSAGVRVFAPGRDPRPLSTVVIPEESPAALLGFERTPTGGGPSLLAVATTRDSDVRVRVYAWDGRELKLTSTLAEPCGTWTCGSLGSCAGGCSDSEACLAREDWCVRPGPTLPEVTCPLTPTACGCRLQVQFLGRVSLAAEDLDADGRTDLVVASSSTLPVTVYRGAAEGPAFTPERCRCAPFGVRPAHLAFPRLGGPPNGSPLDAVDLVIAALVPGTDSTFLAYGRTGPEPLLLCGSRERFGPVGSVEGLAVGRFGCRRELDPDCPGWTDLVLVRSPDSNAARPGTVDVVFASDRDLARASLESVPGASVTLYSGLDERAPGRARVLDANADGHDDLAVLVPGDDRVAIWVGRSNRGLGRSARSVTLDDCSAAPIAACRPLDQWALADVDGDDLEEVVVVCDPLSEQARLRWLSPSP